MNSFRPLTAFRLIRGKSRGQQLTQWLAVHMASGIHAEDSRERHSARFFLTNQNRFLLTDKETGDWTPRGKTIVGTRRWAASRIQRSLWLRVVAALACFQNS